MKTPIARTLCAALLIASNASAQTATFVPRIPITPYAQAAWTDPAAAGSGLLFELVPGTTPTLFGAYFTYTESGAQSWLVVQGPYATASDDTRIATGEIGSASATLTQSRDGPCLTCAYRPPVLEASPLDNATLTFTSATKSVMRLYGIAQTRTLVPLDFVVGKSLPDTLAGTWTGTARYLRVDASGSHEQLESCTVTFTRSDGPSPTGTYQRLFDEYRRAPATGSTFLRSTSADSCGFRQPSEMWLTVDPTTSELVEYQIHDFGTCSPACRTGFDVTGAPVAVYYLVGPNRLVARWDANRIGDTAVIGELQLDRVP